MKKFGGILIVTLMLAGIVLAMPAQKTEAAACTNVSTFGAVSLQLPALPKQGEYLVWVRLQSPVPNGKVLIEINANECLEVSSSSLQVGTWAWQVYQTGGQASPVTFSSTDGNTLKVIGVQAGIKVDRVLLTVPGCTPEDFGDNCKESFEATARSTEGIRILAPPSDQPVSGKVMLSDTPLNNAAEVRRLDYSVGGRTIQTTNHVDPFDTTRLANGKYTILIETTLMSGQVIRESTVITVDNPENVFSPLVRWIRSRQNSLTVLSLTVGAVIAGLLMLIIVRRLYIRRRERRFHGF